MGEIIVTAQKRSESINEVPLSITAVSGDALKNQGITDAASLAKVVPGFVVANTYFGSPVYYLRGVGFYDTAIAARPAVALYADETPIAFPIMAKGTNLDLERVEVLKGPQGTLFGTNATGGAINFIAAKPTREFEAGASLSFGRFNNLLVDGYLSGPISENIRGRLAVSHEYADEWQRSYTTNARNGATDITSGRATIEADASEAFTLRFTASGTRDRSDSVAPQLIGKDLTPTRIDPKFIAYPLAPRGSSRAADFSSNYVDGKTLKHDDWTWQLALRADYEVSSDVTLTSLTSLSRAKQDYGYEGDGTTLAVTNLSFDGTVKTFFQELRASGDIGPLSFIVGGNYQKDKSHEFVSFLLPEGRNGRIFLGLGLPPIDVVPEVADATTKAWAGYANVDYRITPSLTARAGIRYTDTRTNFAGCVVNGGNGVYSAGFARLLGAPVAPVGSCASFVINPDGTYTPGQYVGKLSEDNVSWRGVLDWQINRDAMVYASVSRGYKAGAYSNISAAFAKQYQPVPQESLLAYEVGVKADVVPGVLHVNAALFYYDYSDKQLLGTIPVPVFGSLTALVSIPKSNVKGGEFDVTLRPVEGLVLTAAGTYVKTKVDSHFAGTTTFGAAADFHGTEFPNTPEFQANASATYTRPISNSANVFVGGSVVYRGSSQSDFIPDPRLAVPSYTTVDAQIGVESADKKWRVQLWGRNITNELTYSTIVRRVEALLRTVGKPATYGVTASFRY